MPANHPIFDHLQRDASRGYSKAAQPDPSTRVQSDVSADLDDTPSQPIPDIPPVDVAKFDLPPDATFQSGQPDPKPSAAAKSEPAMKRLVTATSKLWLHFDTPGRLVSYATEQEDKRLQDAIIATPGEPNLPSEVFTRLRWGGLMLYVDRDEQAIQKVAKAYDSQSGFTIEQPVTPIYTRRLGIPLLGKKLRGYAMLARKIRLIQPGDFTERFTYDVKLTPCKVTDDTPDGYLVTKRVPEYNELLGRLKKKFPDVNPEDLAKRAHKLVDHVFPTFLTREAAMLGILQNKLAPEFRSKVPKPLGIEKDNRGFVRTLHMKWVRVGGEPIKQLDFAIQAAKLLQALHEQANIMHLDLRMDNMVITPEGVGFVDFGSACRIGEQVEQSPMLGTLFTEMMRTSQIQRMLGKMIERGHVTNNAIAEVHGKVDKTVDAFYLAVQIAKPHANPELSQLIEFKPDSEVAGMLASLTAAVLRPKNPEMAQYKTAGDLVRGLKRIERRIANSKR